MSRVDSVLYGLMLGGTVSTAIGVGCIFWSYGAMICNFGYHCAFIGYTVLMVAGNVMFVSKM